MLHIVTDSSADIPKELLEKYQIKVVPLSVLLNNTTYQEGINLTPQEFFQKMFASHELPKTSQPSPAEFGDMFSQLGATGDQILCLTISSGLSGTYQSANLGTELANVDVTVFDTLGGSLGHGLQVLKAAELAEQGLSLQEIVQELEKAREDMTILILLDTLENVVKGGRLTRFQGSIAKVLNIKIILEGIQGKIEVIEKVRGNKRFYNRALDIIQERKRDFSNTIFGITHTGSVEDAEFLKSEIQRLYQPKDILVNYMSATMGTYAGKGGIIISFYN